MSTGDTSTVVDVVFDTPVPHPFSYVVPEGWRVTPGQRVFASLKGARRAGVVVSVRTQNERGLKALAAIAPAPALTPAQLELARWIASESLCSLGSTCAALLPPADTSHDRRSTLRDTDPTASWAADRVAAPDGDPPRDRDVPELLLGEGRESRLLDMLGEHGGLVLVPDVDSAGRWSRRVVTRHGAASVVRLDSGVDEAERGRSWAAFVAGAVAFAVGTRSALLAPLAAGAALAVVDEHEAAHKPPGSPRLHTRDIALERGRRDAVRVMLTSATPSVEVWWRTTNGRIVTAPPRAIAWPSVTIADTRGILRREALTPDVSRAMRETLAAGRRVLLVVSRVAASLGCEECGAVLRCQPCGIALAYARATAALACRLCGTTLPLPDLCPGCRGRRLTPFGWSAERVEAAVRRRFGKASIARYDGDARGKRAEAQRTAAQTAEVVIGTRGALKLFGRGALGLAAFISPDHQLRIPDFRAAERAFSLMWAVTERVRPDGAVILQSQNPDHYGVAAVVKHDLATFYDQELKFRAELGYPPFRRLAVITVKGRDAAEAQRAATGVSEALRASRALVIYPPAPARAARTWRVVAKGSDDLPRHLEDGLAALGRERSRGIISVEVDPVEWQS